VTPQNPVSAFQQAPAQMHMQPQMPHMPQLSTPTPPVPGPVDPTARRVVVRAPSNQPSNKAKPPVSSSTQRPPTRGKPKAEKTSTGAPTPQKKSTRPKSPIPKLVKKKPPAKQPSPSSPLPNIAKPPLPPRPVKPTPPQTKASVPALIPTSRSSPRKARSRSSSRSPSVSPVRHASPANFQPTQPNSCFKQPNAARGKKHVSWGSVRELEGNVVVHSVIRDLEDWEEPSAKRLGRRRRQ
jgi:hypothetical protein